MSALAMTTRLIGARIPRNEDERLLRGGGCFVDDVYLATEQVVAATHSEPGP